MILYDDITKMITSAQELHLVGSLAAPIVNVLSPVLLNIGPKGSLVSIISRLIYIDVTTLLVKGGYFICLQTLTSSIDMIL